MGPHEIDLSQLDLRIVASDTVRLHERTDHERVERLMASLVHDLTLKNPPLAAELPEGGYVILDGATRTTALRGLGCRDLLIQVVGYPGPHVRLDAWSHVLPEHVAAHVLAALPSVDGVEVIETSYDDALHQLDTHRAVAAIIDPSGVVRLLKRATGSSTPLVARSLMDLYGGFGEIYRVPRAESIVAAQRVLHVGAASDAEAASTSLVVFPTWSTDNIIESATTQDLLPAGITRHIIEGRALNVNISLDILQVEWSLEAKAAWLEKWLQTKIERRKVRVYLEPVVVFDD
jgi:hypothetical protein